jgi:uncharacterized protein (TIGR03790 family)
VKTQSGLLRNLARWISIGIVLGAGLGNLACARGLTARELGVLINTNDPQSVAVGEYYRARRGIPPENIVRVALPTGSPGITVDEFRRIKALIDRRTPGRVQAFAVTWVSPYRVLCMSLNTAIAIGFDLSFCSQGCSQTRPSAYYDSDSMAPSVDLGIRPAMSIAAPTIAQARALIDRGLASDGTAPHGTAYLLSTPDAQRNVRAGRYGMARAQFGSVLDMQVLQADGIRDRQDVMFYFTGIVRVPDLRSNRFLPGAIGDHLTSAGGDLLGDSQMSILDWISAGATGSYGTVVEPCNFPGKFPDVPVLLRHYLEGETLIEAYWKSVAMPGQGIFVGEPLARPYPGR